MMTHHSPETHAKIARRVRDAVHRFKPVFCVRFLTKDLCDMCKAPINIVDNLVQFNGTDSTLCEYRDEGNCLILYTYVLQENGSYTVLVQRTKVCKKPRYGKQETTHVPWTPVLIGIIAGILLLGIFLIGFIKLGMFIQERREYARFEKERSEEHTLD
ncbi:integrin beta-1-like [Amphiura filiformis]|uniref:integrin beta-1-like n=1 Tax=Amphiura filiformis TaxID=82378 RepID=UPI003B2265E2